MLQLENVSKTYANGVKALDCVSLTLGTGMFGLLGPNGAGKSSLMRTLATLQLPDSGAISYNGQDITTAPQTVRQELGYLPQDFGVYPRISCRELLNHLALLKGLVDTKARRRQIDALLEQTNLTAHAKKAVSEYSGGMRQRFGIAQALLGSPRLVIVDEPTAGLDPEERNRFHNLLAGISESTLVILSTHIVEDIANLCPRFAVMNRGSIQVEGETSALLRSMAGKVWEREMAADELAAAERQHRVLSHRLSRGRHLVRVLSDAVPADGFTEAEPNLEDVYFSTLSWQGAQN